MKKILFLSTCLAIALFTCSCSESENKDGDTTIPYFDTSIMGTWESKTKNDTIYVTFSSTSYSMSAPYFEQILWKPSKNISDNIKERWYYQWVSNRTLKRHQSASDIAKFGETIKYKISAKGDSLFLGSQIYTKNNNMLSPL